MDCSDKNNNCEKNSEVLFNPSHLPDAEAIWAYLNGVADESQKAEVQEALNNSPDFRRHVITLSNELNRMTSEEGIKAYGNTEIPESAHSHQGHTSDGSILNVLKDWFGRQFLWVLIPAATVIILVSIYVFVSVRRPDSSGERHLVSVVSAENVGTLSSDDLTGSKSVAQEQAMSYQTAYDAALSKFQNCIEWSDNGLVFNQDSLDKEAGPTRSLHLMLRDIYGDAQLSVSAGVPIRATNLEAWLITLPSGQLVRSSMPVDSAQVQVNQELGNDQFIVFTYQLNNTYKTSNCIYIKK